MVLYKCNRCDSYVGHYDTRMLYSYKISRQVCYACWYKWHNDGYGDVWRTFHRSNNGELADKLMLDFLGKLD